MITWTQMRTHNNGQALIEMAIVFTLLLFLLIGVVDIGRAFNSYITITNAAREGARTGSRYPAQDSLIKSAVRDELDDSSVPANKITITVACNPTGCSTAVSGDSVLVTVDYLFDTIIGDFIGMDKITLRSRTEMVIFGVDDD